MDELSSVTLGRASSSERSVASFTSDKAQGFNAGSLEFSNKRISGIQACLRGLDAKLSSLVIKPSSNRLDEFSTDRLILLYLSGLKLG